MAGNLNKCTNNSIANTVGHARRNCLVTDLRTPIRECIYFSGAGRGVIASDRACSLSDSRFGNKYRASNVRCVESFACSKAVYFACRTNSVAVGGRVTLTRKGGLTTITCRIRGGNRTTGLLVAPLVGFHRRSRDSAISSLGFRIRGRRRNFDLVPGTRSSRYVHVTFSNKRLARESSGCVYSLRTRARISGRIPNLSYTFYPCSIDISVPTNRSVRFSMVYSVMPLRIYGNGTNSTFTGRLISSGRDTFRVLRTRLSCASRLVGEDNFASSFTIGLAITTGRFVTRERSANCSAILTKLP